MGLPRVLGCCAPLLYRGKKWGEPMARYIPGIKDPISGRRETRFPAGERPVSGHHPRDPGKVAGRAGARVPMCCCYG